MPTPRVTLRDIANDLGLAVITVSKAIRNHPDISKATKARVRERMLELNYQPNWAARSLATGKSFSIGVVVPDLVHPFFAEVAKGISGELQAAGYCMMITSSEEDPKMERLQLEVFLGRQVDALILASTQDSANTIRLIESRQVPYVLIDRRLEGVDCSFVGVDDEQLGRMATEHLIHVGCRIIAHIRGPEISTGIGRVRGYESALAANGMTMPAHYIISRESSDTRADASGYEAMKCLLKMDPGPDGVVCYNDPTAVGAMKAIAEAGLRVPADIAVIGAGDDRYASELRVPLTTIDQQHHAMGRRAAKLVLRNIAAVADDKPFKPEVILLPPKLILRQSTQRPWRQNRAKQGLKPVAAKPGKGGSRARSRVTRPARKPRS
jgi:LacI family transcriptional regulator